MKKKNMVNMNEKAESRQRTTMQNQYMEAILKTTPDGFWVVDNEKNIIEVNEAYCSMVGYTREEVLQMRINDFDAIENPADTNARIKRIIKNGSETFQTKHICKNGLLIELEISVSYLHLDGGKLICFCRDITDRNRSEQILKVRLSLLEYARDHSLEQLLEKTLDEIGLLTDSPIGFYHFIDNADNSIILKAWSSRTSKEFCNIGNLAGHKYPVKKAGVWADSLREKRPIVHNDYNSLPSRKGLPEGHAPIARELVVPVIRGNEVVAILGVGNKPLPYTDKDVELVQNIADYTWEIVASKHAEEELHRFKNISDIAVFGQAIADKNEILTYVNRFFAKIHGYEQHELIGKHFSIFHSENQMSVVHKATAKLLKQGYFEPMIVWRKHKEGWEFPMLLSGVAIKDHQGDIQHLAVAAIDISERIQTEESLKQSQARNKALLEAIPDTMFVFDKKGCFKDYNINKSDDIFLIPEDLLDKHISQVLPPEYAETTLKKHADVFTYGKTQVFEYEMKVGNTKKHLETRILPLDEDSTICIIRDITAAKEAKQNREQLQIAKKTAIFKQNFLANMSHEIRTPLTGILGMMEIMEQTHLDEHQKEYLQIIKTSGKQLKEIIDQVLDYSKIEAGKIELKTNVFHFGHLPGDTLALYKNNLHPDVGISLYIDPLIPEYIEADGYRLSQVLNNLISNAVKFTRQGSVSLQCMLIDRNPALQQYKIKISVTDTGPGIPKHLQENLFTPFSQIEEFDTRNYEGTGLGLSICRELVNLMKGELGMQSREGFGSTFWFTFYATPAKKPVDQIPEPIATGLNHKLNILLAEDKVVNQKVISLMLISMGNNVEITRNGQEVLECYQPDSFDLIFMDIQMPVMDGITATQKLKEKYDNLPPIVGLSANAFEGDREKYMALGMDEYLTKPVKKGDFEKLIGKLFSQPQNPQSG